MSETDTLLVLSAIGLLAWTIQSLAGFGANLLLLTFGSYLLNPRELVAVILPLNTLQSLFLLSQSNLKFNRNHFRFLISSSLLGLGTGIMLSEFITGTLILKIFALSILLITSLETAVILKHRGAKIKAKRRHPSLTGLYISGVIHGMYAAGGAAFATVFQHANYKHEEFRTLMQFVLIFLNTTLLITLTFQHRMTEESIQHSIALIPALVAGIIIGTLIGQRVKEFYFRIFLNSLIFCGAIGLLFK